MKYRKKPVVIEAFKYDGDFIDGVGVAYVPQWAMLAQQEGVLEFAPRPDINSPYELHVNTLEGKMRVSVGDYVIKGVQGEIYPCKPGIFHATYEVAE